MWDKCFPKCLAISGREEIKVGEHGEQEGESTVAFEIIGKTEFSAV